MYSELYLRIAGLVLTYFLQIAIIYVCCLALSQLCNSPRWCFVFWQSFTVGAGVYWLVVLYSGFVPDDKSAIAYPLTDVLREQLQVPTSSGHIIAIAGMAAVWLYVGCVTLFLLRLGVSCLKVSLALRHGTKPGSGISELFFRMRCAMGLSNCELLILPGLASPATACLWRPKILLPAGTEQLGDENAIADVLWHELAHVRRRDYLWACVSDIIRCFVFFHPAIWRARKQMHLQRELACDQVVIADRPDRRADYAECLTRFARFKMLQDAAELGIDFAASPSLLAIRINSLLEEPQRKSFFNKCTRVAMGLFVMIPVCSSLPFLTVAASFAPQSKVLNIGSPTLTRVHRKLPLKPARPRASSRRGMTLRTDEPRAGSTVLAAEQRVYRGEPAYFADNVPSVPNLQAHQADASGTASPNNDGSVWSETAPGVHTSPRKRVTQQVLVALDRIIIGGRASRKDNDDRHFNAAPFTP